MIDRNILDSKGDNNDHDENYEEFDLLADMKDRSTRRIRTTSESGPRYLRSLSENQAPHTPIGKPKRGPRYLRCLSENQAPQEPIGKPTFCFILHENWKLVVVFKNSHRFVLYVQGYSAQCSEILL